MQWDSKGMGFAQQLATHRHWHIDVSCLNIGGTFYYMCSVLDGFSRFIVNREIRESMTEADIEIILQGAREKYPEARPPDHIGQRAAVRLFVFRLLQLHARNCSGLDQRVQLLHVGIRFSNSGEG